MTDDKGELEGHREPRGASFEGVLGSRGLLECSQEEPGEEHQPRVTKNARKKDEKK